MALDSCQKIIDRISEKYIIRGLDSLLEVTADKQYEFSVAIYKKNQPINEFNPVAIISGNAGYGELDVAHLHRDLSNNTTRGTGRLLLDLVACHAVNLGLTLTLIAAPKSKNLTNTGLYNFYNSAGLTGMNEVVKYKNNKVLNRWKKYSTLTNKLKAKFIGGARTRRRRHSHYI